MRIALVCSVIIGCLIGSYSVRADVVTEWNTVVLDLIRTKQISGQSGSRLMAMVHLSMFDAMNSVSRRYTIYRVDLVAPTGTSIDAAGAGAAHRVLSSLYPDQTAAFDTALDTSLAAFPNDQARADGLGIGQEVADQILTWRSTDNSSQMVGYTPRTDPGRWQPTPPMYMPAMVPGWQFVTPFAMTGSSQLRQAGPPELTGEAYATAYNEVKTWGDKYSLFRTADQTETAKFWVDMPGMNTAIWHLNTLAQSLSQDRGLTPMENARLFALVNMTIADGIVAGWDMKYHYDFWRPVTAIQNGDRDGNDNTTEDKLWEPLIATPAFPEYVSNHSLVYTAGAVLFARFFGDDNISFTRTSQVLPGVTRSYSSFSAMAKEVGRSRIYGGIHFEFSNADGAAAGTALGHYVCDNYLEQSVYGNDGLATPAPAPPAIPCVGWAGPFGLALLSFGFITVRKRDGFSDRNH